MSIERIERIVAGALRPMALLCLAGCAGTVAPAAPRVVSSAAPVANARAFGTATFGLRLDGSKLDARGYRHRNALSLETASVTVTLQSIDGVAQSGATPAIVNLLPNSPSCMPDPTGEAIVVCSVAVTEPAGNDVFALAAFDEANATGNRLSAGTASATIPAGGSATVPLTFDPIVASLQVLVTLPSVPPGIDSPEQVFVEAKDAGGASIIGIDPYVSPIVLVLTDPDHLVTLDSTTFANPSVMANATVHASSATSGSASIGATVNGVASANIVPATISIGNDRNWTNGTTFAYTGTSTTVATAPGDQPVTTHSTNTSNESFATSGATIVRNVVTATTPGGSSSASTETQRYTFSLFGDFSTTHLDLANYTYTDAYGGTGTDVFEGEDIIDEFPESAGETFPNANAFVETYQASANDPIPSTTYENLPDGAYSYEETYANGDAVDVTADPQRGSTYAYVAAAGGGVSYTIASPAPPNAGSSPAILVVRTISSPSPAPSASPAPTTSPSPMSSSEAFDWYPATPDVTQSLQIDDVTDLGPKSVPVACGVSPTFAAPANLLHENFFVLDPVAGTTLDEQIDTYIIPGTGVVCRSNFSTENVYYEYGNFAGTSIPLSTLFGGTLLESFVTQTYSGLQTIGHSATAVRFPSAVRASKLRPAGVRPSPLKALEEIDRMRDAAESAS